MSDTVKDDSASAEKSETYSNIVASETEHSELTENKHTDIQKLISEDSSNLQEMSFESNLPNLTTENAPVRNESSTLDLLISVTREKLTHIHLCYSSLFQQTKDPFQSDSSDSKTQTSVSNESRRRSKSAEVGKKHESKQHKRAQSYRIRRKLDSPDSNKKSKSSKSSKKKNSDDLMSELLAYLESTNLKEIKIESKSSCEAPATIIKQGNEAIVRYGANNEVEYHFGFFKRYEITTSPTESSDSGTLTPGSDDSDSKSNQDPSVSFESNFPGSSSRLCSFEQRLSSNSPELCMKFKLSKLPEKIKFLDSFKSSKVTKPSKKQKLDPIVISRILNPAGSLDMDDPFESLKIDIFDNSKLLDESVGSMQHEASIEPKQLDLSVRPKQLDLPVTSNPFDLPVTPNPLDPPVTPKQLDPPVTPKQLDPSVKLKQFDPSREVIFPSLLGISTPKQSETKLPEPPKTFREKLYLEYRLEAFILIRRSRILYIRHTAECVKELMESITLLNINEQDTLETIHVRWKQSDSTDWHKVFYYWDIVKEDIKKMVGNITTIYEELYDKSILPTTKQFYDFMQHLEHVCREARELHKTCMNGMRDCNRYCSNPDSVRFFNYATSFLAYLGYLLRYLGKEVRKMKKYKQKIRMSH